jgi:hypothetical protein
LRQLTCGGRPHRRNYTRVARFRGVRHLRRLRQLKNFRGVSAPSTFRTVKNFRGVRHLVQLRSPCCWVVLTQDMPISFGLSISAGPARLRPPSATIRKPIARSLSDQKMCIPGVDLYLAIYLLTIVMPGGLCAQYPTISSNPFELLRIRR